MKIELEVLEHLPDSRLRPLRFGSAPEKNGRVLLVGVGPHADAVLVYIGGFLRRASYQVRLTQRREDPIEVARVFRPHVAVLISLVWRNSPPEDDPAGVERLAELTAERLCNLQPQTKILLCRGYPFLDENLDRLRDGGCKFDTFSSIGEDELLTKLKVHN